MPNYVSVPLAGSSYLSGRSSKACLRHIVDLDGPWEALCGKVSPDSLLQDSYMYGPASETDCKRCAKLAGVQVESNFGILVGTVLEGDSTEADKKRPSAAKRGYGHGWRKKREAFLEKNPKCSKCGGKAVHAHHSHRKGKGGSDGSSNLVALCQSCHSAITNKTDKK